MKQKIFSFSLMGGLVLLSLFLLWQRGPKSKTLKRKIFRKKLSINEEVAELIELLGSCSPRAEPYLYQRLQTLTGLSFGYLDGLSKKGRREVLVRWVKWWEKNKDLSPKEWLSQACLDRHYSYRPSAIVQMGKKKPFSAGIKALITILKDKDQASDLQKEAARTLGRWKVKEAYPQFQSLLLSQKSPLILAGLYGLQKIKKGFAQAVPFLSHSHSRIREQAAQTLFEIDPQKAKTLLPPLLADPELPVRIYVLDALETVFSKGELQGLIREHVGDLKLRKRLEKKLNER